MKVTRRIIIEEVLEEKIKIALFITSAKVPKREVSISLSNFYGQLYDN